MARPRHEQPTPAELEILKILWTRGSPASVRDVLDLVNGEADEPRAYTSVMSLLNVMTDKGLLRARAARPSLSLRGRRPASRPCDRCFAKRSSGFTAGRPACWLHTCSTSRIPLEPS